MKRAVVSFKRRVIYSPERTSKNELGKSGNADNTTDPSATQDPASTGRLPTGGASGGCGRGGGFLSGFSLRVLLRNCDCAIALGNHIV